MEILGEIINKHYKTVATLKSSCCSTGCCAITEC